MRDLGGELERALIEEYLQTHGHDRRSIEALPESERHGLLEAASVYAAGKLTEIEARAHFVHELHGEPHRG